MAEPDFEKVKKIVRSVLIPCQRGCTLREFLRSYKELNGINLPYVKLGYSSDLHLLQNMPDAVIIQYSRNGDVVLSARADESTQHIQNMVSKQKAPKKKPPIVAPVFSRRYNIPPRFVQKSVAPAPVLSSKTQTPKKVAPVGLQKKISKLVTRFPSGLSLSQFMASFERVNGEKLAFRNIGFFTLEECLETVPNISMKTVNNEIFVFSKVSENSCGTQYTASINGVSGNVSYSQVVQSNVQESSNEKSSMLGNIRGNSSFSPVVQSNVLKSTIETNAKFKTNQEQPEPPLREADTGLKWKSLSFTPNGAEASGGSETASRCVSRMNSQEFEEPDDIPPFILKNLRKLADMYPDGIKATEFPSIYENVINTEFDLHSLGYNDLSVFIDRVPHIFKRVEIFGTKKNWLIVPAGKKIHEPPNKKALLHDTIISNIRMLLEANPEGISIDDFLHIYSINCLEPLCIGEFGFTSLESFLINNAKQVPLMIASSDYGKRVHLVQAPELRNPEPQLKLSSEPLSDVVLPGTDILCVELPPDLDITQFFLVYVSSVETPSTFYIQLKCYCDELKSLYDRIEEFYNSSTRDLYTMKTNHVKVNTVCIALWPRDKLWYRVMITSIISLEEVQVFYFDYGTKCTIPISLLRYMKKEFSIMPAQALLSNLACVKPAHHSERWSRQACDEMLRLCSDVSIMAKIDSISDDGILSLVLCNTNGNRDIFINDELINLDLAELAVETVSNTAKYDSNQESSTWVTPVAAGFQTLSLNNSSFIPPPGPPIPSPIPAPVPVSSLYLSSASDHFSFEASNSSPTDSDVFDDDDDMFEKFCEDALSVMKRYVKRVRTVDAYIFHIICKEGDPFVSCGDISALIWDKKDVDYLMQRLQNRQYHLPSLKILQNKDNKDMFYQIEKFFVKGHQKIKEDESQILVCPLGNVIEILNLLGQPSGELRRQIQYELENFNPLDPSWMELSQGQIPDMEEVVISTDDDKLNRLCLYDLIAMKESIRLRAERVQNNIARGGSGMEEIMKMEHLLTRVVHRINQIKEVCQEFNR